MPTAIIGGVAKTRIMRRIGNGSTEPLSYTSRAALHPSYVIHIVVRPQDDDGKSWRQGYPASLVRHQRRQVVGRSSRRATETTSLPPSRDYHDSGLVEYVPCEA